MTASSPPPDLPREITDANLLELTDLLVSEAQRVAKDGEAYAKTNYPRLLGLSLSFLDLGPIVRAAPGDSFGTSFVVPPDIAVTATNRRCLAEAARKALALIDCLLQKLGPNEVFALWMIFLPGSSSSPYRVSVLELVDDRRPALQVESAGVVATFFGRIGSHFSFIEKRSSTLGFTPLYQSLAESLEAAHNVLLRALTSSAEHGGPGGSRDVSFLTSGSRTLIALVRKSPYNKLDPALPGRVADLARWLLNSSSNPVSQIAGLNLFHAVAAAAAAAAGSGSSDLVQECGGISLDVAFCRRGGQGGGGGGVGVVDNNVRYVALQNLGYLASSGHMEAIMGSLDVMSKELESTFQGPDNAVTLHTLRLLKLFAKNSPISPSSPTPEPLQRLWGVFIKARTFQMLERIGDASLQAALCDFLSELSEPAFVALPADRRMLCLTYLLTHCRAPEVNVRSSSFRGLGSILAFKILQSDTNFLVDCAEKICDELESSSHKSIVMSASWAAANLSETLLDIHLDEEGFFGGGEEFPRHLIMKLLGLLSSQRVFGVNMAVQVNVLRSVGCLLRCVDESFLHALEECQKEVTTSVGDGVVDVTVALVARNIESNGVMKVRWNACCAAGKALLNPRLAIDNHRDLFRALVRCIPTCRNFKVKINASSALSCVQSRDVLGQEYLDAICALTGEIERTENEENDAESQDKLEDGGHEETKHRVDLSNELARALCHLLLLGDVADLAEVEKKILSRDSVDNLRFSFAQVLKRLSPEKAQIFLSLDERLRSARQSGVDLRVLSKLMCL